MDEMWSLGDAETALGPNTNTSVQFVESKKNFGLVCFNSVVPHELTHTHGSKYESIHLPKTGQA